MKSPRQVGLTNRSSSTLIYSHPVAGSLERDIMQGNALYRLLQELGCCRHLVAEGKGCTLGRYRSCCCRCSRAGCTGCMCARIRCFAHTPGWSRAAHWKGDRPCSPWLWWLCRCSCMLVAITEAGQIFVTVVCDKDLCLLDSQAEQVSGSPTHGGTNARSPCSAPPGAAQAPQHRDPNRGRTSFRRRTRCTHVRGPSEGASQCHVLRWVELCCHSGS